MRIGTKEVKLEFGRIGILLFSVLAAIVWGKLIWNVTQAYGEAVKIYQLAALLLVLTGLLGVALVFLGKNWKTPVWVGLTIVLFALMNAGLLYFARELRVYPGWDFGAVYQGAVEIAESGAFSESSSWYFTTYPNNMAVCLMLALIFKLFGGLFPYITVGVLLNIALIDLGILFFLLWIRDQYGAKWMTLAMLLCSLFLPFYMHVPIFYTDTFALPFVTGTFFLYLLRKNDSRFLAAASALLGIGYKVKGSLGVILIALLIHTWLQKEKVTEHIRKTVFLVIPFCLLVGTLTVIPQKLLIADQADIERNEFPMEHWIAMGLEGGGGYNQNVYLMTASVEGKEEKKAVDREFIQMKLEAYGTEGLLQHLKEKSIHTWGDGVYFAPEKLKREPLRESRLHSWVLYEGADYGKTYLYCNAVQILLLLGILASFLKNLLRKGEVREIAAMQIAVFGLFLFLLIWETRSRYLVNFVPVFLALGIDSIQIRWKVDEKK